MCQPFENTRKVKLQDLFPSQLYISQTKLERVYKEINELGIQNMPPVPVHFLNGRCVLTDGHTRCVALHLLGYSDIMVEYDTDELDWEMYEICVQWCINEGYTSVIDLKEKIISHEQYLVSWLDRCHVTQKQLDELRCTHGLRVLQSVY